MKRLLNYKLLGILFLFCLWVLSCAVKLKFNGLILGYDYGIYQPDGVHYTFRTLTFIGENSKDAAREVSAWYQQYSYKLKDIDPVGILPQNNGAWGLVKPRVLYSFLSIPFVMLFGIPGMLAIPCLSLLILLLMPLSFKNNRIRFYASILFVTLLTFSPTVIRWMIVNCTDSLLTALFCIYVGVLLSHRRGVKAAVAIDLLFIILTSLTRFCLPFWIAVVFFRVFEKRRLHAFIVGIASLFLALPALLSTGSSGFLPGAQSESLTQKAFSFPVSLFRVAFYEFAELVVLDRVLLSLLILGLGLAVFTIKDRDSRLFLLFLLAGLLVGGINGTVGVNFRYQLPVLGPLIYILSNKSVLLFNKLSLK